MWFPQEIYWAQLGSLLGVSGTLFYNVSVFFSESVVYGKTEQCHSISLRALIDSFIFGYRPPTKDKLSLFLSRGSWNELQLEV